MFNSKYSNALTIVLVIVIIAIIVLVGFFGYNYWRESKDNEEAKAAVEDLKNSGSINGNNSGNSEEGENLDNNTDNADKPEEPETPDIDIGGNIDSSPSSTGSSSSSSNKKTYKGYEMIGAIEIPATNVAYPILSKNAYSKTALEKSICQLYGANPNEVGNMILVGHNLRNSQFFSNNKKLNNGDKIYITDLSGNRVAYTIYNKYETTDTDTEYMQRDTKGKREISLSTCTDDGRSGLRLVIWASAD